MIIDKFVGQIKNFLPIIALQKIRNEISLIILPKYLIFCLTFLKNHIGSRFRLLSCISGVDFIGLDYRFCVSYDFLSLTYNQRLRVKTFVNEVMTLPSIVKVYENANWWEREIWDLYGIFFEEHPDLRRILSDYGFEGFPLRKDFPLYGYIELRYDETQKRIIAEPVELTQDFRFFDFETPW